MTPRIAAPWVAAFFLSIVFTSGCSNDLVSPQIEELRFVGQAPDAPLVLIMDVDFVDPDGNLGDGLLETFINQRPSGVGFLELNSYFIFDELPLDAVQGTFQFVIEVSFPDNTPAGSTFDLGARLIDEDDNHSDTETITLKLQ